MIGVLSSLSLTFLTVETSLPATATPFTAYFMAKTQFEPGSWCPFPVTNIPRCTAWGVAMIHRSRCTAFMPGIFSRLEVRDRFSIDSLSCKWLVSSCCYLINSILLHVKMKSQRKNRIKFVII